MKRLRAIHPPLVAAYPVLSLYAHNMGLLPSAQLWRPLCVALCLSMGLWLAAGLVLRSVERGAAVASVALLCAASYGHFDRLVRAVTRAGPYTASTEKPFWTWVVVLVALAVWAGWKRTNMARTTRAFNVVGCILALLAVGSLASGWLQIRRDLAHVAVASSSPAASAGTDGPQPDVFYLILDGHGNEKQLRRAIGADISSFERALESRGFYVAADSHSNYSQTELSLASSLNMEYVQALVPRMDHQSSDRVPLDALIDRSRASQVLRDRGYTTVGVTSGFPGIAFTSADLRVSAQPGDRSLLEAALLADLPLPGEAWASASLYTQRAQELVGAFRSLEMLAQPASRPRFVFAHIFAPHPPFVFGPNGEMRRPKRGPYGMWDGSHFVDLVGSQDDYRQGYREQVKYIDTLVLKAVDAIMSSARTPPIIVIQGDHGSKVGLKQEVIEGTDVEECFGILNAYYAPSRVRARLYPSISPVNTFRVIFREVFGNKIDLLEDKAYISTWPQPYALVDVTARVRAQQRG